MPVRRYWERKQKEFCPPQLGWQLLSVLKCALSQSCLCSPLYLCSSQGGGVLSHSNSFSRFLWLCFLGIKCHVLDSKAALEVGGSRAVCCNTVNEQERNLEDWQGDTWNILCGLTYLVVVKRYLSFNTRAGTWLGSAQTPWNAHAALVTDSQNTSGSRFV